MRAGMAGCEDAAAQRGGGLIPTWGPSSRTRLIGPQIDHVIATTGITAETFSVHDIARTDHRAVLTRLQLPGLARRPRTDAVQSVAATVSAIS